MSNANFELDVALERASEDQYFYGAVTASLLHSAVNSLVFQFASEATDSDELPDDASDETVRAQVRRQNREKRIEDKCGLTALVYGKVTESFRPTADSAVANVLTQNNPDVVTEMDKANVNATMEIQAILAEEDPDEDLELSPSECLQMVIDQKRSNHRKIESHQDYIKARLNEVFNNAALHPVEINDEWTPLPETALKIAATILKKGDDRRMKNKLQILRPTCDSRLRTTLLASNRLIKDTTAFTQTVHDRIESEIANAGNAPFGDEAGGVAQH